jgi:hypothetical protein
MSPPNEESLVRGVIEESSESDTAAAPTSPWKIKAVRLMGLSILLLCVVPDIILSLVGFSTYRSAETGDLKKEFAPLHPITFFGYGLCSLYAGCAAFFGLTYPQNCFWGMCFPVSLLSFLVVDIPWAIGFFKSPEFSAVDLVWSLDEYEDFVEAMRGGQPQVILEGATHVCSTNPIVMTGVSSTDNSVFPNVSAVLDFLPVVFLHTVVTVHWDAKSVNLLKESEDVIKECRRDPVESVNVTQTQTVVKWKERALIAKEGELPLAIRHSIAIASGIFGSYLYYFFNVDAIPRVTANVVKNNALIDTPGVSCGDVDWRCE